MTGQRRKNSRASLAIFVKYPEPGKVKTRLASELGDGRAARVYARMLNQIMEETVAPLSRKQFDPVLFCDPFRPREDYQTYFSSLPFRIEMQEGAGLGERLSHALGSELATHPEAIAIGSDCLSLTPAHLAEARAKLQDGCDLVIGPAFDGGYYLIGMKRLVPSIFQGIAWSTASVLAQTLDRAKAQALVSHCLAPLSDVDTLADLKASGFRWDVD